MRSQQVVGTGDQVDVGGGLHRDRNGEVRQVLEGDQFALNALAGQRLVGDGAGGNRLDGGAGHPGDVGRGQVVHTDGAGHVGGALADVAVTATAHEVGQGLAVGGKTEVEGIAVAERQQGVLALVDAAVDDALTNEGAVNQGHGEFLEWSGVQLALGASASAGLAGLALGFGSGSGSMKPLARPWATAWTLMVSLPQDEPTAHSPLAKWKVSAPWR
ncbi:hypothetical protein FQZ97_903620 [compost metagenome]